MLVPLIACGSLTLLALAWAYVSEGSDVVNERMKRYAGAAAPMVSGPAAPSAYRHKGLEIYLTRAGVDWTGPQALLVLLVAAVGGGVLGSLMNAALIGMLLGIGALFLRLQLGRSRRMRQLEEQLPEALMLITTSLKAGLGFQQALQLAATEAPQPLRQQLERLNDDLVLGMPMEAALARLQAGLDSTNGEILASALLIQRQMGGNLAEILMNLHDTIRDRIAVRGQIRTLTAQGRLSGYILTALPFFIGTAISMINRPYLTPLFHDPRGQTALGLSAALIVVGSLAIRRIVHITL